MNVSMNQNQSNNNCYRDNQQNPSPNMNFSGNLSLSAGTNKKK
jgi:hypothetical protein